MNQYTVTFTIMAQNLSDARIIANKSIKEYDLRGLVDIKELDPKTHYGGVLAESREQNSAKDSSR